MRLRRIKLAGFKSFVDPTTLHLPSAMVGIVGPNGCGKSNIIDAVRWVMGENSRHLRGDSMEDVIFNGSAGRKPVGQASIELVFDNSDGRAGGQFARFNEIAVRRVVARDGQSKYYLNGSRCRRRDVVDLFLGTGLGPRSYAIIEQGMISRLVEARPEELRVYLEEAAGISKYKERRRETENRIRHTRENLERLEDLRQELDKQLARLKRQARTAERYKALREEERRLQVELLALKLRALQAEAAGREAAWRAAEAEVKRCLEALRSLEAEIEDLRARQQETQGALNERQAAFYAASGEVSRIEQAIQHTRQAQARHAAELEQARRALARLEAAHQADERRLAGAVAEIEELEPRAAAASSAAASAREALEQAERRLAALESDWEAFNARGLEPREAARAERARLEQLRRQLARMEERRGRLIRDLETLRRDGSGEGEALAADVDVLRREAAQARQAMDALSEEIDARRRANREQARAVSALEDELREARGRLASLEALQEAALGKRRQAAARWLEARGLAGAARLAQLLEVESGWEQAVETVLGAALEAVVVESPEDWAQALESLDADELVLTAAAEAWDDPPDESLGARVRSGPRVSGLHSVIVAEDVPQALDRRGALRPGESLITRSGVWMGPDWIRVNRGVDEHAGVLARAREIRALQARIATLQERLAGEREALEAGRSRLRALEASLRGQQSAWERARREQARQEARLERVRARLEAERKRRGQLEAELHELDGLRTQEREAIARTEQALEALEERLAALQTERAALNEARDRARLELAGAREALESARTAAHELALRLEGLRATRDSAREALERMTQRLQEGREHLARLEETARHSDEPLSRLEADLEQARAQRATAEAALRAARERARAVEAALRERELGRMAAEQALEQARERREAGHVAWQEQEVQARTVREQLEQAGARVAEVLESLPQEADADAWARRVGAVAEKIRRLGPINLAAIDEFEEQNERSRYLDAQHADLTEALTTLERAIQKIDRETRQRFRETFDKVNERLQQTFPRLFGGGHAHLQMTGDDLLDTGVAILARPPGKRLSTIHLMSGGEKALTAVALVFAFFELNPAPFCMLDEVDAPLDEANVGRFCELVREMSERVQFIFITHNKTTMEFADHLLGVTMHEPGVSRLVAVDVEEAARMANA